MCVCVCVNPLWESWAEEGTFCLIFLIYRYVCVSQCVDRSFLCVEFVCVCVQDEPVQVCSGPAVTWFICRHTSTPTLLRTPTLKQTHAETHRDRDSSAWRRCCYLQRLDTSTDTHTHTHTHRCAYTGTLAHKQRKTRVCYAQYAIDIFMQYVHGWEHSAAPGWWKNLAS